MPFPGSAGSCWAADTWVADSWTDDSWAAAVMAVILRTTLGQPYSLIMSGF